MANQKHMRLPNGFGRITKITGKNLRKPYRAMVSDGKDSNGKPIGRLLKPESYFKTYNEAYQALLRYNENPYDFKNAMTMDELYDKWYKYKEKSVGKSALRQYDVVWKYCDSIKSKLVQDLRLRDVKVLLDTCYRTDDTGKTVEPSVKFKETIKITISQILDYAVEYEYIQSNFLRYVKLDIGTKEERKYHISFTDEEMNTLREKARTDETARLILINCYMGWRPSELCLIETKNISIKDDYIIGGIKTSAGKNRIVPIHSRIKPYIAEKYNEALLKGKTTLFDMTYRQYKYAFVKFIKKYNFSEDHLPHDCRKQFVTMAKKSGVDEYAIKRIVGHQIKDITENVYTDRSIEWLKSEIEKMY